MKKILFTLLHIILAFSVWANGSDVIVDALQKYISGKDARIGVAVVTSEGIVFGVNQYEEYPMLSVVKFPVVLAVAKRVKENNGSFADSLYVDKAMLHNDTYSPMLQKYPNTESHRIAIVELVDYAMSSDNNACDILMDFVGGASVVDGYIKELGIEGINVKWDENEMHLDEERFRENTSTPMAMAQLMFKFDNDFEDVNSLNIKEIMESCETGTDRLAKSLISTNAVIGHKTGTGPIDKKTGRLMAVNDAGYIHLSNGKRYSIAVFIADSGYSMAETSAIIAKISEIVRDGLIVQ